MADLDKVIKDWESILSRDPLDIPWDLIDDTLTLLKEQEAKPVKVEKNAYNHEFYFCPRCDRSFYGPWAKPKFCDRCGQEITWNGSD